MKVIKEGNWNDPWKSQVTCSTCRAVLEINEADVKPVDNAHGYFVTCPLCKKRVTVLASSLSQRVREEVDAKRKYWSSGDW